MPRWFPTLLPGFEMSVDEMIVGFFFLGFEKLLEIDDVHGLACLNGLTILDMEGLEAPQPRLRPRFGKLPLRTE